MSATVYQFPARPTTTVPKALRDDDLLHVEIWRALESVIALSKRRHYHPAVPSFAWELIEERLEETRLHPSEFLNLQIGHFYESYDGPAPAGWRDLGDPRQMIAGWRGPDEPQPVVAAVEPLRVAR